MTPESLYSILRLQPRNPDYHPVEAKTVVHKKGDERETNLSSPTSKLGRRKLDRPNPHTKKSMDIPYRAVGTNPWDLVWVAPPEIGASGMHSAPLLQSNPLGTAS